MSTTAEPRRSGCTLVLSHALIAVTVILGTVVISIAHGATPAAAWASPQPGYVASVSKKKPFALCDQPGGMLVQDVDFCNIWGLGTARNGDLFISAGHQNVWRVDHNTNIVTRVAGTGADGSGGYSGDGGPATAAQLNEPRRVVEDATGNLYIPDFQNLRIRRVDAATGLIDTVVGTGDATFNGDGLVGTATNIFVSDVTISPAGNLVFADWGHDRVRQWNPTTGLVTTIAGTGVEGFSGDGGPATAAQFSNPWSVDYDPAGNLLIADDSNQRIRRVDAGTGEITTIAGTGVAGFSGDGGPASAATFNHPFDVRADDAGNVYVSDRSNNRVRRIDADGTITTIAGGGSGCCDGMLGTDVNVGITGWGLTIDSVGNILLTAFWQRQVLVVGAPGEGLLSGVATDPDGNPADGVVVVAYSADVLWQARGFTVSAADGSYALPDLPAGSYRLRVLDFEGRYRNEWAGAKLTQPTGDIFEVLPAATTSVDLALVPRPPGALAGKVTAGPSNTPKPGVWVLVVNDTGLVAAGVTNSSGGYWIGGITAGTYRVAFWDLSGASPLQWYPSASSYSDPSREDLIIGGATTTADAHLA